METWDAIKARRNVREFEDRPLPEEHLERVLEAGRCAPSSRNWQPWDFVVVSDREQLKELAKVWQGAGHVAHSAATTRWCHDIGGCRDVDVASDPARTVYARWGLGRTSLGHFLGRRSLTSVIDLARRGIRNRHPHGTRWQMAGTFALDEHAVVRWRHLPAHAGDVPELEQAMRAVT